jgi:GNAT superfamily N-acetyltransferase
LVDARTPTSWQVSGGGPPLQIPQDRGQPPHISPGWFAVWAEDGSEPVARLLGRVPSGIRAKGMADVIVLEVHPDYRHRGIDRQMIETLHEALPRATIRQEAMFTSDGAPLVPSVATWCRSSPAKANGPCLTCLNTCRVWAGADT